MNRCTIDANKYSVVYARHLWPIRLAIKAFCVLGRLLNQGLEYGWLDANSDVVVDGLPLLVRSRRLPLLLLILKLCPLLRLAVIHERRLLTDIHILP